MAFGKGLWAHADFMKLWAAQTVSSFGARIAREGLPMTAVYFLHAGPLAVGVLAALSLAPQVVVGLAAGPFVDRTARRPVLILADVARALALCAIPLAAWLHRLTLTEVYLAAALVGAFSVLFDMADHAYLPSLVEPGLILDGNAKLGATDSVAETGGPAIAGVLFQVLTAPIAVLATALTYLVSAAFLSTIKARQGRPAPEDETPEPFDLFGGVRLSLAHPMVRPIFATALAQSFFGWFFGALYIFYAVNVLKLGPAMLGLTVACGGIGGFAGAAAAPWLTRRLGAGRTIVLSGLVGGSATFLIPLAGGAPLAAMATLMAAQLFGDSLQTISGIGAASLRQTVLPAAALGRTGGAFAATQGLAGVGGALIGGALAGLMGPRETLYVAAAGIALAPLFGLFSPLWGARIADAEAGAQP